ncbi:hypothetical protein EP10_002674 [Geobacillus icigianus]|uniref:Uncharacterized protein n=1 Tax=Geobacillus icigianus TaxID=1430331 RepID=A0ABU6BJD0_9BACL|nr:hypothetical protein [Geobacillus icigianus]
MPLNRRQMTWNEKPIPPKVSSFEKQGGDTTCFLSSLSSDSTSHSNEPVQHASYHHPFSIVTLHNVGESLVKK